MRGLQMFVGLLKGGYATIDSEAHLRKVLHELVHYFVSKGRNASILRGGETSQHAVPRMNDHVIHATRLNCMHKFQQVFVRILSSDANPTLHSDGGGCRFLDHFMKNSSH